MRDYLPDELPAEDVRPDDDMEYPDNYWDIMEDLEDPDLSDYPVLTYTGYKTVSPPTG